MPYSWNRIDPDLIPSNIKNGVDIFGVVGNFAGSWGGSYGGPNTYTNYILLWSWLWGGIITDVSWFLYQDSNVLLFLATAVWAFHSKVYAIRKSDGAVCLAWVLNAFGWPDLADLVSIGNSNQPWVRIDQLSVYDQPTKYVFNGIENFGATNVRREIDKTLRQNTWFVAGHSLTGTNLVFSAAPSFTYAGNTYTLDSQGNNLSWGNVYVTTLRVTWPFIWPSFPTFAGKSWLLLWFEPTYFNSSESWYNLNWVATAYLWNIVVWYFTGYTPSSSQQVRLRTYLLDWTTWAIIQQQSVNPVNFWSWSSSGSLASVYLDWNILRYNYSWVATSFRTEYNITTNTYGAQTAWHVTTWTLVSGASFTLSWTTYTAAIQNRSSSWSKVFDYLLTY